MEMKEQDNVSDFKETDKRKFRRSIMISLVSLGLAFMMQFTAYMGSISLQSTINKERGLGTTALASVYLAHALSALTLPQATIRCLSCKWAIAASLGLYIPYIAVQFYPKFATLLPAAVVLGIAGGPLWAGLYTYLTTISMAYSTLYQKSTKVIVARFFGIFYAITNCSVIWGNLISSTVLSSGGANVNESINFEAECGVNFCPQNVQRVGENSNLNRPPDIKIYIIAGIYIAFMIMAVLLVTFGVSPLKKYERLVNDESLNITGWDLLVRNFNLLKTKEQLFLIPIILWSGMHQAFLGADFTASYISCAWGIHHIGYVLLSHGAASVVGSILSGLLVDIVGRPTVIILGLLIQAAVVAVLFFWTPQPADILVFFVVAVILGLADGNRVQINAFMGVLFPDDKAATYSVFGTFESLGYLVAYAYSSFLCTDVKLAVVLGVLIAGFSGYVWVEKTSPRIIKTTP